MKLPGKHEVPWPPPDLEEWQAQVAASPEPEYLFEGLIPRDSVVFLTGMPKLSFKTWLACLLGMSAASGVPVGPFKPVGKTKVLLLELEGPAKPTSARFDMLKKGMGIKLEPNTFFVAHRLPFVLEDPEWMSRIANLIKAEGIGLVIIDTFAKATRGDENSVKDVSKAMRALDSFRQLGLGVTSLLIHHINKAGTHKAKADDEDMDIDVAIRGSSALAGFYDCHIAIRRKPTDLDLSMIIRSSEDETRHFKARWDINKALGLAEYKCTSLDAESLDEGEENQYTDFLLKGKEYTSMDLTKEWQVPPAVARGLIAKFLSDGLLEKRGGGRVALCE